MEHTANLWHILDDVCEHSTLGEAELLGTNERIAKLKSMNEELGELESEMEALHSIYAFESKSYLSKLRRLEQIVTAATAGGGEPQGEEEGKDFAQAAIDSSFCRSVCKILYDDKKAKGRFQLVSARLGE